MPPRAQAGAVSSFDRFTQWLQKLNTGGYFDAYGRRAHSEEWCDRLHALHNGVVDTWPMLWGVLSKTQMKALSVKYMDRFPFLDRTRQLPSAPFIEAMLLADEAQVALRSGDTPTATCARCAERVARIALLETQLRQLDQPPLPDVPSSEALLDLLWMLYNRNFMHGVGTTPRDVVRAKVLGHAADALQLDLWPQRDLWNRFVAERLLDDSQRDRKFINCCLRMEKP